MRSRHRNVFHACYVLRDHAGHFAGMGRIMKCAAPAMVATAVFGMYWPSNWFARLAAG